RYEGGQRHPLRRGRPYVDAQHEPRRVEPRVPAHPVVDLLARTHQQSSPPSAPATSSTVPPGPTYQVRCASPGYGGQKRRSCAASTSGGTGYARSALRRASSSAPIIRTAWVISASRRRATADTVARWCWLRQVASQTTVPPPASAVSSRSSPVRSTVALA